MQPLRTNMDKLKEMEMSKLLSDFARHTSFRIKLRKLWCEVPDKFQSILVKNHGVINIDFLIYSYKSVVGKMNILWMLLFIDSTWYGHRNCVVQNHLEVWLRHQQSKPHNGVAGKKQVYRHIVGPKLANHHLVRGLCKY